MRFVITTLLTFIALAAFAGTDAEVRGDRAGGIGNTPDPAGGLGLDHRSRGYLAAYEFAMPVGKTEMHCRAAYDWSSRDFARTGDNLTRSNVEGWRLANSLVAHVAVSPALKLDGGAEHESRRSVEYTNYDGPIADVGSRSSLDANLGYAQHLTGLDVRHGLVISNAFDSRQEIPEFVRRNLNAVPSGVGRRIAYVIELSRRP